MKCLVVGGGGFLGRHLVEKLLLQGHSVSVFDLRQTFSDERVTFFYGDLCKKEDLIPALIGIDLVFHCATPSPLSNNRDLFYNVNYRGTVNLIEACKQKGVKRLVLTSSASVVYEGKDIKNGSEDLPYAGNPMDYYTESKIIQEKAVLSANCDSFATVAIRPHGIFGPRDPHMLPTIAKMARAGKTKFIIGNGRNTVDFTHVSNVVDGHILAANQLEPGSKICGKAYNITNDEPIFFWTFMAQVLAGLGYDRPKYCIPFYLVYVIAVLLAFIARLIQPLYSWTPTFSPMSVTLAGTDHYYSCEKAKRDLSYKPAISLQCAITQTVESFAYLKKTSS